MDSMRVICRDAVVPSNAAIPRPASAVPSFRYGGPSQSVPETTRHVFAFEDVVPFKPGQRNNVSRQYTFNPCIGRTLQVAARDRQVPGTPIST